MLENFYTRLPARARLKDFLQAPELLHPAPEDWWVVVMDVVDSTRAIDQGRYRDVNVLGAALITAFINHTRIFVLPHTFGGDGAGVLIPPEMVDLARQTLGWLRRLAQVEFELDLHSGVVSMSEIREVGEDILVGRLEPCAHYCQAVFCGGGLRYAERLIKSRSHGNEQVAMRGSGGRSRLFNGLVCPWEPIVHERGCIVNLIAEGRGPTITDDFRLYTELIQTIEHIQGVTELINPVSAGGLEFSRDVADYRASIKVKTAFRSAAVRWLRLKVSPFVLRFLEQLTRRGIKLGRFDFAQVKAYITEDVDYLKYDDLLCLTTVLADEELQQLRTHLERQRGLGRLRYGLSTSPSAVLTCYVQRDGQHLGLLDGSNGGFTRAAQQYKRQLDSPP